MRVWKPLAVGVGALVAVTATLVPVLRPHRGVRLMDAPPVTSAPQRRFDQRQSAALFIGVRKFTHDMIDVPYAVDDAVDLAYAFALDPRIALVPPERVVMALSGRPQKDESKRHLDELIEAGAQVGAAEPSDILTLLQRQSAKAGPNGILIVSIATHGFVKDGIPYVLGSTSLFQFPETALPAPKLFDIAATSEATRSLFFIDACRERITNDVRSRSHPATAAPLLGRMGRAAGQVVFYAAAAGGYAYDDDGNGVFTKAVLEGLHCKAALVRGAVTVETLRTFVEREVRRWIRQHRDPTVRAAIQVSMDGDSKNMVLASCIGKTGPQPPGNIARMTHEGSTVRAFASNDLPLWSRAVDGQIRFAEAIDLDADNIREAVAGAKTITVFDRTGARRWSIDTPMTLHTLRIDDLLRHDPTLQLIALWNDERTSKSRIAVYNANGQSLSVRDQAGLLDHLIIDRPTSHYTRKIIAAGDATVMVLDSKLDPLWTGTLLPSSERITRLTVLDHDNDSRREIAITTTSGNTLYLDFAGNVLPSTSRALRLKIPPRGKQP